MLITFFVLWRCRCHRRCHLSSLVITNSTLASCWVEIYITSFPAYPRRITVYYLGEIRCKALLTYSQPLQLLAYQFPITLGINLQFISIIINYNQWATFFSTLQGSIRIPFIYHPEKMALVSIPFSRNPQRFSFGLFEIFTKSLSKYPNESLLF